MSKGRILLTCTVCMKILSNSVSLQNFSFGIGTKDTTRYTILGLP